MPMLGLAYERYVPGACSGFQAFRYCINCALSRTSSGTCNGKPPVVCVARFNKVSLANSVPTSSGKNRAGLSVNCNKPLACAYAASVTVKVLLIEPTSKIVSRLTARRVCNDSTP